MGSKADELRDRSARLRTIRRLASPVPSRTAAERLKTIEDVASGKVSAMAGRPTVSADMAERLKAGQASRSPRNALDKQKAAQKADEKSATDAEDEERKRKRKGDRDRLERGGLNRSADVNL